MTVSSVRTCRIVVEMVISRAGGVYANPTRLIPRASTSRTEFATPATGRVGTSRLARIARWRIARTNRRTRTRPRGLAQGRGNRLAGIGKVDHRQPQRFQRRVLDDALP